MGVLEEVRPQIFFPKGEVFVFGLLYENQYVTWAYIEQIEDKEHPKAFILHIETLPEFRRQGLSLRLVEMLQEKNTQIETNVHSIGQPSAKMLLKAGFKFIKAPSKKLPHIMRWLKINNH